MRRFFMFGVGGLGTAGPRVSATALLVCFLTAVIGNVATLLL
jgi:hypothetical protein